MTMGRQRFFAHLPSQRNQCIPAVPVKSRNALIARAHGEG